MIYQKREKKEQSDKQWSTKFYTKNYKLNNTNPTEKGDELGCSGRLSISCFTNGVRCIIIPNMPVINLQK